MPPLNYFVVESPEEVGRKAYERVAGDVLQDLDLIKVIDRLHIYVDPKIPIFIAAGVLHHMPRTIRVGDFANVNRGDTRIVLDIGDETYLAPLLRVLWEIYGKENVEQPDRFTVILPAGMAGEEDLEQVVVADPGETLHKDVIYAMQYLAPEGFKVRRQYIRGERFYYVASEDTLPGDVVERMVMPLFERMGGDAVTTLVPVTYKGGVYRHDEIMDLIDDLGGYVVQKHVMAQDVVLQSFVPREDINLIRAVARPLAGQVTEAPLVGTEIAVVSPSLEIHHLPHTSCDIAEYLRRSGAKTNMVGLARGFGKRIANLNDEERDVINEHDLAVYMLGNFEECIQHKFPVLRRGIHVPIVVTGAPDRETLMRIIDPPVEGYVGGIGRIMHRFKRPEELAKLDELVDEVSRVLDARRDVLAKDPLSVFPPRLMTIIEEEIPVVNFLTHPTPVTVQMEGLRVKLPYDSYAPEIRSLEVAEGVTVGDVAEVKPSRMRNYILIRVKPFSETRILV